MRPPGCRLQISGHSLFQVTVSDFSRLLQPLLEEIAGLLTTGWPCSSGSPVVTENSNRMAGNVR